MLLETVRSTCQKYALLAHGDSVVVGVSGGADSCALLLAMIQLTDEWNLSLHVAHLNHQIRGAAADEDAAFVQSLADRFSLPCAVEKMDVPAIAKKRGWSLEQAGREARYQFFNQLADAIGAHKIAVGHTADDLLETMLLNWCRGAGPEGLAGMPPKLGRVVRPLFEVTREEAQAFCAQNGLTPQCDASNEDVRYLRNRVRHELVPHCKKVCPSALRQAGRLAEVLREENAYLDGLAREVLTAALRVDAESDIMLLSVEDLAQRSLVLQRRALRQAVRQVKGDLENVAFKHIEQIVDALRQQPHKGRWTLPDGVDVALEGRTLSIRKRKDREDVPPDPSQRWTLNVPGAVDIPELGMRLEAAVVEGVPPVEHHPQKAFVDADKLEKALTVRLPQVGERFRPLGMNGTKKVMELLGDVKVPRQQRMRTPMVLSDDAIVWVVGYRIDDRFKVTSSTRRTVILKRFNVQTFKRSNVLQ